MPRTFVRKTNGDDTVYADDVNNLQEALEDDDATLTVHGDTLSSHTSELADHEERVTAQEAQGAVLIAAGSANEAPAINALLAAPIPIGQSRRVVTLVGAFRITQSIVVKSDTLLDLTRATITLAAGSNCYMIGNEAIAEADYANSVSMTIAASAITGTGFSADWDGLPCAIADAGFNGSPLYGRFVYSSPTAATIEPIVYGETTSTVVAAASVSGKRLSIFGRNHKISIVGGHLVREHDTAAVGYNNYLIALRRVDGFRIEGQSFESTDAKYAINVGDCHDGYVDDQFYATQSDGVHVNGPASGITITRQRGTTHDDLVSFTAVDYWDAGLFSLWNDVSGDIVDCLVDDIAPNGCATGLKILGGTGGKIRRLTARNLHGVVQHTLVSIPDDLTGPSDVEVLLDGIKGRTLASDRYLVFISASAAKTITIRNYDPVIVAGQTSTWSVPIWVATGSNIQRLAIDGVNGKSPEHTAFLKVIGTATIGELAIANAEWVARTSPNTSYLVWDEGNIAYCKLTNIRTNHCKSVFHQTATAAKAILECANITGIDTEWLVTALSTAGMDILISNMVMASWSGYVRANAASGTVLVRSTGCMGLTATNGVTRSSTATVKVVDPTMPVDVSILTPSAGDMAYNTNAGLACGVGPVLSNGTLWKHLYTGATT